MDPRQIVLNWLKHVRRPRKELGGMSICPFAKLPNIIVVDTINESCFEDLTDEITVYVESAVNSTFEQLDAIARKQNEINPTHVFLPDHPHKKNYINGIETGNGHLPLIIAQTRRELAKARDEISKTDYYDYWDEKYLAEIRSYGN